MTSQAGLPALDTLLQSINAMEKNAQKQPRLWDPQLQTNFVVAQQPTASASAPTLNPGSLKVGSAVMAVPAAQQQDLFLKNYINKQDGVRDLQKGMQTAAEVHKKATTQAGLMPSQHVCRVYPPLLVRYHDPRAGADAYIPVELFAGAELHYAHGFPDLILNFHADTHAITVTTCRINAAKMKEYELAMQVLYSLTVSDPDRMLTVPEFTALYDNARSSLLRSLALASSRK